MANPAQPTFSCSGVGNEPPQERVGRSLPVYEWEFLSTTLGASSPPFPSLMKAFSAWKPRLNWQPSAEQEEPTIQTDHRSPDLEVKGGSEQSDELSRPKRRLQRRAKGHGDDSVRLKSPRFIQWDRRGSYRRFWTRFKRPPRVRCSLAPSLVRQQTGEVSPQVCCCQLLESEGGRGSHLPGKGTHHRRCRSGEQGPC